MPQCTTQMWGREHVLVTYSQSLRMRFVFIVPLESDESFKVHSNVCGDLLPREWLNIIQLTLLQRFPPEHDVSLVTCVLIIFCEVSWYLWFSCLNTLYLSSEGYMSFQCLVPFWRWFWWQLPPELRGEVWPSNAPLGVRVRAHDPSRGSRGRHRHGAGVRSRGPQREHLPEHSGGVWASNEQVRRRWMRATDVTCSSHIKLLCVIIKWWKIPSVQNTWSNLLRKYFSVFIQ